MSEAKRLPTPAQQRETQLRHNAATRNHVFAKKPTPELDAARVRVEAALAREAEFNRLHHRKAGS